MTHLPQERDEGRVLGQPRQVRQGLREAEQAQVLAPPAGRRRRERVGPVRHLSPTVLLPRRCWRCWRARGCRRVLVGRRRARARVGRDGSAASLLERGVGRKDALDRRRELVRHRVAALAATLRDCSLSWPEMLCCRPCVCAGDGVVGRLGALRHPEGSEQALERRVVLQPPRTSLRSMEHASSAEADGRGQSSQREAALTELKEAMASGVTVGRTVASPPRSSTSTSTLASSPSALDDLPRARPPTQPPRSSASPARLPSSRSSWPGLVVGSRRRRLSSWRDGIPLGRTRATSRPAGDPGRPS